MNRYRNICKHCLRPGRGNCHMAGAILERIFDEKELAADRFSLGFDVGNAGLKDRIPVHHSLATVNKAAVEPIDKDFKDRLGILFIQREPGPRPIEGTAKQPKLTQDRVTTLSPPLPDPLDKGPA